LRIARPFSKRSLRRAGVKHVFVNGIGVVKDGKVTDAKPGIALRGPVTRDQFSLVQSC